MQSIFLGLTINSNAPKVIAKKGIVLSIVTKVAIEYSVVDNFP